MSFNGMSIKSYGTIGLTLLLAIAIAFFLTPLIIRLAHRIGWMDVPRDKRRMHHHPVPLLGGLSIIAAFLLSICIITTILGNFSQYYNSSVFALLQQILPGGLLIAAVAFLDDRFNLPPLPRLGVQVVAAGIAVALGVRIHFISGSVRIFGTQTFNLHTFSIPITILWIVGMTNAMNWIDGLDGLAAGISTIASVTLLVLATLQGRPQLYVAILTAALAGGCLGLLPYNKNPARIFMGDTGAMFLGYTLGIISIQGLFKFYTAITFAIPVLILALPIFDTASAIFRRLIEGKSPLAADRSHIHHKLIDMGLSQKQAVAFLYGVSGMLSVIAVFFTVLGRVIGWRYMLLAIALVLALAILGLNLLRRYNRLHRTPPGADTPDDSPPPAPPASGQPPHDRPE